MPPSSDKAPSPPYLPFKTLENTIEGLKGAVIPSRVDRTLFNKQSGTIQTYLISSMKFFGLIDESSAPTALLSEWVNSDDQGKALLKRLIPEKYTIFFDGNFPIKSATLGQFKEKLSEIGLNGDSARKALIFFGKACEEAGIEVSPHLKGTRGGVSNGGSGGGGTRKGRKKRNQVQEAAIPLVQAPAPPTPKTTTEVLLNKFPDFDPTWDQEVQKVWFANFSKLMQVSTGGTLDEKSATSG